MLCGVGEKKSFTKHSYQEVYGVARNNYYPKPKWEYYEHCNRIQMNHLYERMDGEIDMLLDVDKGELELCLVGLIDEAKRPKLWNLPLSMQNGWVPHFNIYQKDNSVRIASIPVSWYGIEQIDIFSMSPISKC